MAFSQGTRYEYWSRNNGFFCISASLSFCFSVSLWLYLSLSHSILLSLFIFIHFCLSDFVFVCLFVCLSTPGCLSIGISLLVCFCMCSYVCHSLSLSVHISSTIFDIPIHSVFASLIPSHQSPRPSVEAPFGLSPIRVPRILELIATSMLNFWWQNQIFCKGSGKRNRISLIDVFAKCNRKIFIPTEYDSNHNSKQTTTLIMHIVLTLKPLCPS